MGGKTWENITPSNQRLIGVVNGLKKQFLFVASWNMSFVTEFKKLAYTFFA